MPVVKEVKGVRLLRKVLHSHNVNVIFNEVNRLNTCARNRYEMLFSAAVRNTGPVDPLAYEA